MRYDQSMRALKTLLDRGELGQPVVAEIVMNARPHWQEFIKPYGRIALLNMSIHHLDAFRYLFGDPERILVSVRPDPSHDFPHEDGHGLLHPRVRTTACARSALDNCFTWADHRIEWRVEGTEGDREGHDRLARLPGRQPVHDRLDDAGDGRGVGARRAGRSAGSRRRSRARWAS